MSNQFQPPPFRSHRLIRGGHLQTIASLRIDQHVDLPSITHRVELPDGDQIVLHDDQPPSWRPGAASLLLIHGLCGCHAASYMLRLASRFFAQGVRVFRLDMRGCGAGAKLARELTHAGRSDDVLAALAKVATLTQQGPIGAIGVSLGGNQLLRAVGRVDAGMDCLPSWWTRLERVAAVAPPIDLLRCSENMERWILRPYNYYFIRLLLQRVPAQVRRRSDFQRIMTGPRPKTMRQLDDRITAPLSGLENAADYYRQSAAIDVVQHIRVNTLVIAAGDDPVVPVGCFTDGQAAWSSSTRLIVSPQGGHVGFIDRQRQSWMDDVVGKGFEAFQGGWG